MLNGQKLVLIFTTSLIPYALSAGTMGPIETNPWAYAAALSVGPAWATGQGTWQTFFLTPDIERTYTVNHSDSTLVDGALFLGLQTPFTGFTAQFGLELAAASDVRIAGTIWDDADPAFNNFIYHYEITHYHVAAKGKLIKDMDCFVDPYLSASIGIGFNQAHGFRNEPLIFEAIAQPDFKNHTTNTFTYTVGAGIQREWNKNWQTGIGYEFADWGKSNLNRAPGQTLGTGLVNHHVYTNGLMVHLTYIV